MGSLTPGHPVAARVQQRGVWKEVLRAHGLARRQDQVLPNSRTSRHSPLRSWEWSGGGAQTEDSDQPGAVGNGELLLNSFVIVLSSLEAQRPSTGDLDCGSPQLFREQM